MFIKKSDTSQKPSYSRQCLIILATIFFCSLVHAHEHLATKVTDKPRFVVASSNNFPPINLLEEQGVLAGFGRDLSTAVIRAVDYEPEYIHSDQWVEVLNWLDTNKADLIHDAGYTPDRESFLDFTIPILEMPEVIFVQNGRLDIHDLASLEGKKVACVKKHITHLYLQKFPAIKCHIVNTPSEGLVALINGDVDAFIYPEHIVRYFSQKLGFTKEIKIVGDTLRLLSWSMAVKEGNKKSLDLLNEGIRKVKANGDYERIYNHWFGKQLFSGYSKQEVSFITLSVIIISLLFGISIGLALYARTLKITKKELSDSMDELKVLNSDLDESRSMLNLVTDNLPALISYVDSNQRYHFVNSAYEKKYGVGRSEIIGKRVDEVMGWENYLLYEDYIKRVLKGEQLSFESVLNFRDDEKCYYAIDYIPNKDNTGNINGFFAMVKNITEQKRTQKAVEGYNLVLEKLAKGDRLEEILEELIYTIEDQITGIRCSILFMDKEGKNLIWGVAPTLSDNFKNALQDIPLGKNTCVCGATANEKHAVISNDIQNNPLCANYRDILEDEGIAACWSNPIFSPKGKVLGAFVIYSGQKHTPSDFEIKVVQRASNIAGIAIEHSLIDKSLQRHMDNLKDLVNERTQKLGIARDQALLATQSKSNFLANMSHELRTPLHSITTLSKCLKDGMTGDINTEQKKQMDIINYSAEHLLILINNILDLSKVESGMMSTHKAAFSLQALVNKVNSIIQPQLKKKKLDFVIEAPDKETVIYSDKTKLSQVILNLLGNAVKFTETGKVILVLEIIETDLHIEVTDAGIGIEEEKLATIFDPFVQLDDYVDRQFEGTGLGLTLCKQYVELMGGSVSVTSRLNEGSTFRVVLKDVMVEDTLEVNSDEETYLDNEAEMPLGKNHGENTARR